MEGRKLWTNIAIASRNLAQIVRILHLAYTALKALIRYHCPCVDLGPRPFPTYGQEDWPTKVCPGDFDREKEHGEHRPGILGRRQGSYLASRNPLLALILLL